MTLTFGNAQFQIPKVLEHLWQSLEAGFGHRGIEEALTDERTALACRLFIDNHFETSDDARLLSLIGVLEVLKEQYPTSARAQELVEEWIVQCDQLDSAEADSLRGSLKRMKSISIGRGIRTAVERRLGPERAREAQELYNIRSELVHDGKRPEGLSDAVRRAESLTRDLLLNILTAGRPG